MDSVLMSYFTMLFSQLEVVEQAVRPLWLCWHCSNPRRQRIATLYCLASLALLSSNQQHFNPDQEFGAQRSTGGFRRFSSHHFKRSKR
jgi:hypothetical protein